MVGPAASDAPETGNPVQIGGSVDDTSPAAAAEGDVRRVRVSPEGNLLVEVYKDNTAAEVTGSTGTISGGTAALFAQAILRAILVSDSSQAGRLRADSPDGDAESTSPIGLITQDRLYGLAPDGSWDRLRTLGDAAPGLGVLAAAPYTSGASEVNSVRGTIGSTTRATLLTPTSGKKVRIISVEVTGQDATAHNVEVYFAAGANITTTAGKEICEPLVDLTDAPNYRESYPDGGGLVGAVDDVISVRWSTAPTTASIVHIKYREE